jgi:hypothetical protein
MMARSKTSGSIKTRAAFSMGGLTFAPDTIMDLIKAVRVAPHRPEVASVAVKNVGLERRSIKDGERFHLPPTTLIGYFNGVSPEVVGEDVLKRVTGALTGLYQ